MELKKTTILSAFVVVSGILAEIIFRDILSKSFVGVALSIALAVVVLIAFYFTIDGVYYLENLRREEDNRQQKEYEQRVYSVLNEQLKFQKAVYGEVKALQQQLSEGQQEAGSPEANTEPQQLTENMQMPEFQDYLTRDDLMQMVSEMNDNIRELLSDIQNHTEELISGLSEHTTELASGMNEHTMRLASGINDQNRQLASEVNENTAGLISDANEHVTELVAGFNQYMTELVSGMNDRSAEQLAEINAHTEELVSGINAYTVQAVSEINDHTMQAAKVVAKFVGKNTEEIKKEIQNQ